MGFVANDYALLAWGLDEVPDPAALLSPQGLRDGLETWLAGNAVMKRTFRSAATVAGLIEKNLPGARKTGRQATFSTDILYDTLRKYDPGHLLLRITRAEAGRGLVDFGRIEEMLARSRGRLEHRPRPARHPPRRSPLPRDWAACRSRAAPRPAWSAKPPPRFWPRPASLPTSGKQLQHPRRNCRNSSGVRSRSRAGRSLAPLRNRTAVTQRGNRHDCDTRSPRRRQAAQFRTRPIDALRAGLRGSRGC